MQTDRKWLAAKTKSIGHSVRRLTWNDRLCLVFDRVGFAGSAFQSIVWMLLVTGAGYVGLASNCLAQDPAAVLEDALVKVVEQAEPSVVSIARFRKSPEEQVERPFRNFPIRPLDRELPPSELDLLPNEFGAGLLIGPPNNTDRFVLTNYHVVRGGPIFPNYRTDDETELRIKFFDRRGCLASIIAADPRSDLAVLRLRWEDTGVKPTEYPRLNWNSAPAPRKGQFVILLGNPHAIARDGSSSVSWGIVSNLTRQPIMNNRGPARDREEMTSKSMLYRLGLVMQLDARLNLGTSGGPVLNLKGELIGISTSLAAIEGYEQTAGFAIPIDTLTRRVIRTLLQGQEVEYGMLGIEPAEVSADEFIGLNTGLPQRTAARVLNVQPDSPADRAGILAQDMIVKVDGEAVRSVADLMRLVGLHAPEAEVEVVILRNGRPLSFKKLEAVKVKLGKWPVMDDEGIIETNPRFPPWRGLTIDYPTARARLREQDRGRWGLSSSTTSFRRVLVTKVAENSTARDAGLEVGNFITQVNDTEVNTPAEFYAAVNKASGPVTLKLIDDSSVPSRSGRIVLIRE